MLPQVGPMLALCAANDAASGAYDGTSHGTSTDGATATVAGSDEAADDACASTRQDGACATCAKGTSESSSASGRREYQWLQLQWRKQRQNKLLKRNRRKNSKEAKELTLGLRRCNVCREIAYAGRGTCMNVSCNARPCLATFFLTILIRTLKMLLCNLYIFFLGLNHLSPGSLQDREEEKEEQQRCQTPYMVCGAPSQKET